MVTPHADPLIVLVGPTASGKTSLAIRLAQEFNGEIVSCDSVAVYREMEIGTAKPSREERALVQHHMIDIAWPDEPCTAGDYSRQAREALTGITERGCLPIVAGGTGLYLRALIDGLFPAPPQKEGQRDRLRRLASARGPAYLHRLLTRLDAVAAAAIHPNDVPKVIRAIEVSLHPDGPRSPSNGKKAAIPSPDTASFASVSTRLALVCMSASISAPPPCSTAASSKRLSV